MKTPPCVAEPRGSRDLRAIAGILRVTHFARPGCSVIRFRRPSSLLRLPTMSARTKPLVQTLGNAACSPAIPAGAHRPQSFGELRFRLLLVSSGRHSFPIVSFALRDRVGDTGAVRRTYLRPIGCGRCPDSPPSAVSGSIGAGSLAIGVDLIEAFDRLDGAHRRPRSSHRRETRVQRHASGHNLDVSVSVVGAVSGASSASSACSESLSTFHA